MIQTQTYDVKVKDVKMTIEDEQKRKYAEDGKIVVGQKVSVKDTVDAKDAPETTPDGKIKPYGLETDGAYDVEVKEKVPDEVIQEHIDTAIASETPKPAKRKEKNGIRH